jgi:mRNA-degrading endonuclease RelE of RelBE toxin-antitoxin system
MGSYQIEWKPSALKELRGFQKEAVARIVLTVEKLADNPFPSGVRKPNGFEYIQRILGSILTMEQDRVKVVKT